MVFAIGKGQSLFCRSARLAASAGYISIQDIQRAFRPGLREASEVVDLMVRAGVVGDYGPDHRRPYLGGVVL